MQTQDVGFGVRGEWVAENLHGHGVRLGWRPYETVDGPAVIFVILGDRVLSSRFYMFSPMITAACEVERNFFPERIYSCK